MTDSLLPDSAYRGLYDGKIRYTILVVLTVRWQSHYSTFILSWCVWRQSYLCNTGSSYRNLTVITARFSYRGMHDGRVTYAILIFKYCQTLSPRHGAGCTCVRKNPTKTCERVNERNTVTMDVSFWINIPQWCAWQKKKKKKKEEKTYAKMVVLIVRWQSHYSQVLLVVVCTAA